MGEGMSNRTTIDKFLRGLITTSISVTLILLAVVFVLLVRGGG
jgi:hypothetical protein